MCIIAVKPAGVEWPTWNTLRQCWERNPDGAGLMYNDEFGNVVIEKGFMEWSDFRHKIKQIKRLCTSQTCVVMHFRIKTHGEVSRECCHPFPLEGSLELLRRTEIRARMGVAHNGVITGRDTSAKKSDTMDYILNILYPLAQLTDDLLDNKYIDHLIEDTIGTCRLAILEGSGRCIMYGTWYDEGGMHYSNTSYKETRVKTTSTFANYGGDYYTGSYYTRPKPAAETKQLPGATDMSEMEEDEFEAVLQEMYGWDDSDDPWSEDYQESKSVEQAKFLNQVPSRVCYSCPEYMDCVANKEWICHNEDEVAQYVAILLGGYGGLQSDNVAEDDVK